MNKQRYYEIIPQKAIMENFDYMQLVRMEISRKISNMLDEEKQKVFQLINFVGIGIDRLVDRNKKEKETFLKFADLMEKVWKGRKLCGKDDYESSAIELISKLRKLKEKGFDQARYIFSDLQDLFCWQYQDVSRRWKILSLNDLQKIRIETSKGMSAAYFYLLFPKLKKKDVEDVSLKCGLAVNTADDLIDWYDDIQLGLINIPKEEIENLHGVTIRNNRVEHVYKEELALEIKYIKKEIITIEHLYRKADKQLKKTVPKNTARGLLEDFMNSWLLECKEKYLLD